MFIYMKSPAYLVIVCNAQYKYIKIWNFCIYNNILMIIEMKLTNKIVKLIDSLNTIWVICIKNWHHQGIYIRRWVSVGTFSANIKSICKLMHQFYYYYFINPYYYLKRSTVLLLIYSIRHEIRYGRKIFSIIWVLALKGF